MSLWSNTDAPASKPKFAAAADLPFTFFVSTEEALIPANKDKGINGAGWWDIREYKDGAGNQRYKTILLVAMSTSNAISGDDAADDATVADVNAVAAISVQPTSQTTISGAATFSVTAAVTPSGTISYQWQKALGATATRFANVLGATSSSLVVSAQTAGNTGDKYRVVVASNNGAVKVNSTSVTLTFGT
jgi:hypothetical protein